VNLELGTQKQDVPEPDCITQDKLTEPLQLTTFPIHTKLYI